MSISLKIANRDEQKNAQELVNSVYAQNGYVSKDETRLIEKARQFKDKTITIIALKNEEIVGTISLVLDSKQGLPMDDIFGEENDGLRSCGRSLCEVAGFAVTEAGFRTGLILCQYVNIIAVQMLNLTDYVVNINPEHRSFYTQVLKFVPFGMEKIHPYLANRAGVPLRLDLVTQEEVYKKAYEKKKSLNPYSLFYGKDVPEIMESIKKDVEEIIRTPEAEAIPVN